MSLTNIRLNCYIMLDELYILSSNIRLISNRGLVWFYFINNKYQTELLHRAGLKPIKPTAANSTRVQSDIINSKIDQPDIRVQSNVL
jgi:hypothetical protein